MFAFWSTGYSVKLGAYPKCLQKLNNCNDEAMVISQRPNLFRKHRHKFMLHHLNADHDVSIFAKDKFKFSKILKRNFQTETESV